MKNFVVVSVLFLLIWGYVRNFLLNNKIESYNIVITTVLFTIWFGSTKILSKILSYMNDRYIKPIKIEGDPNKENIVEFEKQQWNYYN